MKIISTKEYNELKKTQSAYLDLLMKPLQGVFEKVTDDELLRDNANLYAENKKLHSIIKEVREYCINRSQFFNEARIEQYTFSREEEYSIENILEILDKVDKENNNEK